MKVGDTSDEDPGQPREVSVITAQDLSIFTPYVLELYVFSFQCPALSRHKRNIKDTPWCQDCLVKVLTES